MNEWEWQPPRRYKSPADSLNVGGVEVKPGEAACACAPEARRRYLRHRLSPA